MTQIQDLAVGKTGVQKYSGLGFSGQKMVHPPGQLLGLLVGMPGTGKSSFLQSNPDAFIINTDGTSTTNPNPQACIWPGVTSNGEPMDVGGQKMVLTWDEIIKKKEQLIKLAEGNQPRPQTIVLDSLGPSIQLMKDYVTKKAGRENWKDLDGRRAWDDVYDGLLRFSLDLRRHGYGFFYVCHLVNAKIPLGDDRYTIRPELTITDNFYKRLFPMFELVAAFESDWISESKQIQMKGIGGKPGPKKTETVKTQKYYMTINDESLAGITKCRVQLPDRIELPQESAWTSFEGQYLTAQKKD